MGAQIYLDASVVIYYFYYIGQYRGFILESTPHFTIHINHSKLVYWQGLKAVYAYFTNVLCFLGGWIAPC